MVIRISLLTFASLLLAVFVSGCGKQTRSPIVQVGGTIEYEDGEKLPVGTKLLFSPVLGGAGSAMAETDADGNFSLQHSSGTNGAEIGKYVVALRSPEGREEEFYASVPTKYTNGDVLSAEVPDEGGSIALVLSKSKAR